MFKKIIIAIALIGLCSTAHAELNIREVVEKIPALKQGIAYSLADSKFNYLSTIELASWKNITIEAGYAGAAENTGHKIVGVVSYPIVKLADLGVKLPVLDLVELNVGGYVGYGRVEGLNSLDDSEFDYGISATLIKVKF